MAESCKLFSFLSSLTWLLAPPRHVVRVSIDRSVHEPVWPRQEAEVVIEVVGGAIEEHEKAALWRGKKKEIVTYLCRLLMCWLDSISTIQARTAVDFPLHQFNTSKSILRHF